MNYQDERYVRVYTRDSLTWISWSWETRAVFVLLLRKVDRAGVLDTGSMEKAKAISLLVGVPIEVAEVAVKQLIDDGTATETPTAIVFPRFLDAQECKQSDAHRQRESRLNRRTKAVSERIHEADSHTMSQDVTDGHTASRQVTPYRAVLSRTVPSRAVPKDMSTKTVDPSVSAVFDHWVTVMGSKAVLSDARAKSISARLGEGFTVDDLKAAVDGCARNPFNMGENDTGTKYNDIGLICRNAAKVEQYKSTTGKPANTRAPVAAESTDWTKVQTGEIDL